MPGTAASTLVSTVPQLLAALKACTAACAVVLAPGDWHNVQIDGVKAHATVTGTGVVVHDLTLTNSSGITFSGLEFSTVGAAVGPFGAANDNWFRVTASSNITFDKLKVHGDSRGSLANTPSGFLIRESRYITVSNSEFSYLHHALAHLNDEHVTISNNTFHNLMDDSIRGGGTSWITISNNLCYSNHPDASDPDHPDCIQFWTSNTTSSAHDITITDNRYDRGTAHTTQFIFLGNEKAIPYYNATISGNRSYGSMWNGIAVSTARNVTITNNNILPSCKPDNGILITGRIVTGDIDGLKLYDNVAGDFLERAPNRNKLQGNNRKAGCVDHSPF
jgi:hypothetical protein